MEKSATGNSILRKPQTFKAMATTESVTTEIQFDHSVFDGRTIKVVDGPGVGDNRMSDEEALKLVQDRLVRAIAVNPDGYHAFLLVVRYGGRFTKEDIQTISCLKKIFGEDFVKNFCILVITCGDNFETDAEEEELTFEQWLQNQRGFFEEMLHECNKRVILFNNKTKDDAKKKDQVQRLIVMVDSLGGKRYTDEHFEKAKDLREKQMIGSKETRVREKTMKETAVLMQTLEEIQLRQPDGQISDLQEVLFRARKLFESVQDEDKGTGALKSSVEAARALVNQVNSQLEHCQKVVEDKKKFYEEEERLHKEFESEIQKQKEKHAKRVQEVMKNAEEKRKEETEAIQKKWEEEKRADDLRQQQDMEALRKEMANRTAQERRHMEKMFQEKAQRDAAEAEERYRKQLLEYERKMKEAEKAREMLEEENKRKLEEEKRKWAEEEKLRQEKLERERQDEQERHERELQRSVQAYKQAKKEQEELLLKGIMGSIMAVAQVIFDGVVSRKAETVTRVDTDDEETEEEESDESEEEKSDESEEEESDERVQDVAGVGDEKQKDNGKKEDADEKKKDGTFVRKNGVEGRVDDEEDGKMSERGKKDDEDERDVDETKVIS